jgi:nicotinic acid phosphoribosyltransferase
MKPLNIVIKLVECNGKPVAKLSDSPGKTICHDKAFACVAKRSTCRRLKGQLIIAGKVKSVPIGAFFIDDVCDL